jgi:hypothetical protein
MRLFNITNRPNNYPREHQIENVSFKGNRTIIIDNLQFDIQFYGTTWLVNSPEDESKIWNRNCGSIRAKRYKNLNKKYLTPKANENTDSAATKDTIIAESVKPQVDSTKIFSDIIAQRGKMVYKVTRK